MNIYTNNDRTRYFKTNNFDEGLIPVQIESLEEAVVEHPSLFTLKVVLDQEGLYVSHDDEILALDNAQAQDKDALLLPFVQGLSYGEIVKAYLSTSDLVSDKIVMISELSDIFPASRDWEGDVEKVCLKPHDGDDIMIIINHYDVTVDVDTGVA